MRLMGRGAKALCRCGHPYEDHDTGAAHGQPCKVGCPCKAYHVPPAAAKPGPPSEAIAALTRLYEVTGTPDARPSWLYASMDWVTVRDALRAEAALNVAREAWDVLRGYALQHTSQPQVAVAFRKMNAALRGKP